MIKNILLTGAPSSGKTTVIKKILSGIDMPVQGFYTEEERIGDRRVGFMMKSLDGRQGYLAHQDLQSAFHIRRYGVSIQNIDEIAAASIMPRPGTLIILDEIGTMECYSRMFREAAEQALDSPNIVVGTVTLGGSDFIRRIKERDNIEIIEVTAGNRNTLPDLILDRIRALQESIAYQRG
jgi:nucleoside-triphosphatase